MATVRARSGGYVDLAELAEVFIPGQVTAVDGRDGHPTAGDRRAGPALDTTPAAEVIPEL